MRREELVRPIVVDEAHIGAVPPHLLTSAERVRHSREAGRFSGGFPDEGDMRTLHEVDYPYMVTADHLPRHPDDLGGRQAFAFGYGYIKALIQAVGTRPRTLARMVRF